MSEHLIHWRDEQLNSISPSFCAAKWYNASIHLGSGYTGSCHLPLPHLIDKEKIMKHLILSLSIVMLGTCNIIQSSQPKPPPPSVPPPPVPPAPAMYEVGIAPVAPPPPPAK